jgi:ABC-type sugar transport system permease subunit
MPIKKPAFLKLPYILQYPVVAFSVLLLLYPLAYVFWLSTVKLNLHESWVPEFVGLGNYIKMFADPLFYYTLWNSLIWSLGSTIGHFCLGLGFALLMNEEFKGRAFFRGVFFIPWVVPITVTGIIWRWVLSPDWGLYTNILRTLGILGEKEVIDWLADPNLTWPMVIYVNLWKAYPFMYVCFLSALQTIPPTLYEAAQIDGAGTLDRFRYITWPILKPVSALMFLLGTIWTFINFEVIWLLTSGGPGYFTTTYAPYVYILSFKFWRFGDGAAYGVFGLIICLIFAAIYIKRFMGG